MIPEHIPLWFYVILVVAIALSWMSVFIGPNSGSHTPDRSGTMALVWSMVCILGIIAATLWWRGELFNVVGWFTR